MHPDDLANLILLLVSDYASAVTGQFILADMGAHIALNRPASVPRPHPLKPASFVVALPP